MLAVGCGDGGAHAATQRAPADPAGQSDGPDFKGEVASNNARKVALWVTASRDNRGSPFIIVDKRNAKVFVFDKLGNLEGAAPALLGLGVGDDSVPGIGQRRLATIRPVERTTPAGRFQAALGHDLEQDVLWIDYDLSLSLHRVIVGSPKDGRRRRLASPSPLDNRISYGCINVPAAFYDDVVNRAFAGKVGFVYILPEVRSLSDVFPRTAASLDHLVDDPTIGIAGR